MKKFLIFLLCGVMLLTLAACGGNNEDKQTESIPHEEGDVYVSYANEPTVDMFIQGFIKNSSIKPHNIRKGDRDGDYIFTVDQVDVTMRPEEKGMSVSINCGQTAEMQTMAFTVFEWCVLTLDADAGKSDIQNCIAQMSTAKNSFGDVRLSMYCKLSAYIPPTNIETVKVDGRIDLWGFDYKADTNATKSTIPYNTTAAE